MTSFFGPLRYSSNPRRAVVALLALAWISFTSCHRNEVGSDEIRDAAQKGDLATVQTLLKSHPHLVFSKDDRGDTPLHWASAKGHKDVAQLLLASGADVNARNNNGWTPLHYAVSHDRKDVVELLLANKADVNAKTDG